MNCPRCSGIDMTVQRVSQVTIDRCSSCHGIWLDAGELERLIEMPARALFEADAQFVSTPNEAGPRINCPRCKGTYLIKLNSRQRSGTMIDSCTVCFGAWLDAGELARLGQSDALTRIRAALGLAG